MAEERQATPGLDAFWETCDRDGLADHPLERELVFRLDALQRYRGLISEAEAMGNDDAVELLSQHYERQTSLIREIREALRRLRH